MDVASPYSSFPANPIHRVPRRKAIYVTNINGVSAANKTEGWGCGAPSLGANKQTWLQLPPLCCSSIEPLQIAEDMSGSLLPVVVAQAIPSA